MSGQPLFFDLETVPNPTVVQYLELPQLPRDVTLTPSSQIDDNPHDVIDVAIQNVKDFLRRVHPDYAYLAKMESAEREKPKPRAGLFEAVREYEQMLRAPQEEAEKRRKLLATTPEYCQVCAMGAAIGDYAVEAMVLMEDTAEEEILEEFWAFASEVEPKPVVGYNIKNFDLKVILARSCILGVQPTRNLELRWTTPDVIDLMQVRFGNQPPPKGGGGKLKTLAKLYGIGVPAGDVDGSQVAQLLDEDPHLLRDYVMSDVTITRALYQRWLGYFLREAHE